MFRARLVVDANSAADRWRGCPAHAARNDLFLRIDVNDISAKRVL
jgi:hypothetical protein